MTRDQQVAEYRELLLTDWSDATCARAVALLRSFPSVSAMKVDVDAVYVANDLAQILLFGAKAVVTGTQFDPLLRDAVSLVASHATVLKIEGKTVTPEEIPPEPLFLDANGKPGGTRVKRYMPRIPEGWKADVLFYVIDDTITEEAFHHFLELAGQVIGIGRFRPINGGFYGRYAIKKVKWSEGMVG